MKDRSSPDLEPPPGEGHSFVLMAVLALLVGLLLRLYLLRDQILVDDEWHSMAYVVGKPFSWLLVHFSVPGGFTSIPLNLYQWILCKSVGWSEGWMRMPSVVLGVLCLVLGPILAKPLVGARRGGLFAILLAISPLLVFYSRLVRPYCAVVLLSFVGLFFAERWMRSGALRHGLAFAVCGVLAVYSHLFAAVTVATAGVSVALFSMPWKRRFPISWQGCPSQWQVLAVLSGMGFAGAILVLPAFVNSLQTSFLDVAMQGSIPVASWLRFASLVSGTANPLFGVLFWGFFLIGVADLGRRHARFTAVLVALFPMQALAMLLARPHSCHVGIVLARYGIVLVPVSLLLAACGLQACLEAVAKRIPLKDSLLTLLSCAFAAALGCVGPLPGIYVAPNNFTNHGVFQHRYGLIDWTRSFVSEFAPPNFPLQTAIRVEEVSTFYSELRKSPGGRPVVEYPMMIGDHFNPLYYYQFIHRRPVIAGYARAVGAADSLFGGGVYGNTCIDDVLGLVESPAALRFRNLVDMRDLAGMRARGAEYAILHKRFEAELWQVAPQPSEMRAVMEDYRATLRLVYEDAAVAVFGLDF